MRVVYLRKGRGLIRNGTSHKERQSPLRSNEGGKCRHNASWFLGLMPHDCTRFVIRVSHNAVTPRAWLVDDQTQELFLSQNLTALVHSSEIEHVCNQE
jgi:hypothetical protein